MRNFAILLALALLSSCRSPSFLVSDLDAPQYGHALPPMVLQFDENSFMNHFPAWRYVPPQDSPFSPGYYVPRRTEQLQDMQTLIERSFKGNLCEYKGPALGTAVCRLITSDTESLNDTWVYLSVLSLGVAPMLGLPTGRWRAQVGLEVELFDIAGDPIARYRGAGLARRTVGFYYGHSDFKRTLHLEAVKQAMAQIASQIQADEQLLRKELGL
jgi:hypothetical protein